MPQVSTRNGAECLIVNMKPINSDFRDALGDLLVGRVCIVGVGNRGRGDDGAGPRVIDLRRPTTQGFWIDVGVAPENHLEPIAQTDPDTILIVDAVNFRGSPGQSRLMDASAADRLALSTHAGSLSVLAEYWTARTNARLSILGIQPKQIGLGVALSDRVEESVRELAAMLSDLLSGP
jgi:hydrogenase 3 maturation protease